MNDKAIVAEFFRCLGSDNDAAGLAALISADALVETHFSPEGQLTRFDGRDQILARFAGVRYTMASFGFHDIEVYATDRAGELFATCTSSGTHVDGRHYANGYCWQFRIVDGQIAYWREFYDPQKVVPFIEDIAIG
ncbi:nuclear transport factor 2 family protein [Croceicoccus mobilis]|uniref:SnoaL-like domain-containing protein n=1 Tax=Croceicoccus mobilis TaxID=1703339 RepID=A0A916Z8I4_9SPHN|nr:nuclear transport factor 2 family protein [Croceicoccus mobilis]GGD80488.1 hypothetical protein GCM10010990_32930 [Croceicoccus mobilis]